MVLTGTPGIASRGFFYDCWVGAHPYQQKLDDGSIVPLFKQFHWTMVDNTLMPIVASGAKTSEQVLSEMRLLCQDDSEFNREYLGRWDDDLNKRVYRWDQRVNDFDPSIIGSFSDLTTVMGIDSGHNHADAVAILGYSPSDELKRVFLIDEWVRHDEDRGWSGLLDQVKTMMDSTKYPSPSKIVIDPGAGGSKWTVDLRNRHGINANIAQKENKNQFIHLLNDSLIRGRLMIRDGTQAADESFMIFWKDDPSSTKRSAISGKHSDIWDAILYAWRECRDYSAAPKEVKAKVVDPFFLPAEELVKLTKKKEERRHMLSAYDDEEDEYEIYGWLQRHI
jgi:hypothetical protein